MKIICTDHCIYKLKHTPETKKLQVSPEDALCSCMLPQHPFNNIYRKFSPIFHSTPHSLTASPRLKEKGILDIHEPQLKVKSSYEKIWAAWNFFHPLYKTLEEEKFITGFTVFIQSLLSGHLSRYSVPPTTLQSEQFPLLNFTKALNPYSCLSGFTEEPRENI